jgi:hypothetical protein
MHRTKTTFKLTDDGHFIDVATECSASDGHTIRIPLGHLRALTIALMAACQHIGLSIDDDGDTGEVPPGAATWILPIILTLSVFG